MLGSGLSEASEPVGEGRLLAIPGSGAGREGGGKEEAGRGGRGFLQRGVAQIIGAVANSQLSQASVRQQQGVDEGWR